MSYNVGVRLVCLVVCRWCGVGLVCRICSVAQLLISALYALPDKASHAVNTLKHERGSAALMWGK